MPPAARRTTRTRAPRAGTAGNGARGNDVRNGMHGQDVLPLIPASAYPSGHPTRQPTAPLPCLLPAIDDPYRCVGIDEAGRGCLAGPVVAAAVILPPHTGMADLAARLPDLAGLTDSKKLTARMREALAPAIRQHAVMWGLGVVWPGDIDRINILQATFHAMLRAVRALHPGGAKEPHGTGETDGTDGPDGNGGNGPSCPFPVIDMTALTLIIDGDKTIPDAVFAGLPPTTARTAPPCAAPRQRAVVGGDALVPAVSAASILAKTFRDRLMVALDRRYPGYGLAVHKGYGTAEHCAALELLGPCPVHRTTFRKVRPETAQTQGSLL